MEAPARFNVLWDSTEELVTIPARHVQLDAYLALDQQSLNAIIAQHQEVTISWSMEHTPALLLVLTVNIATQLVTNVFCVVLAV